MVKNKSAMLIGNQQDLKRAQKLIIKLDIHTIL